MASDDIATNIKQLYFDPLTANAKCHFNQKNDVRDSIDGDFLISSYIPKMNEEIFSNPPLNMSTETVNIWNLEKYSEIFSELLTQSRAHGYALVQFNNAVHHQIFSEPDRQDWVLDNNKLPKGIQIIKDFNNPDASALPLTDVIWNKESQVYLFKYAEGNNRNVFAKADLNQAMWTCAVTHRQIQAALDVIASKPEFYFLKFGTGSLSDAQKASLMQAVEETSILQGIGASPAVCTGIDVIQYTCYADLLNCLADKRKMFAGLTRLPLAYFNGERTSGSGTGGSAENMVERKINKRKIILFNKIKPLIIQIFKDRHSIDVSNIELDLQEEESIVEENNPQNPANSDKINSNNDPQPATQKQGWFSKFRGK